MAAERNARAVFALTVGYVVELSRVNALLGEHVAYLDRFYADGTFLLSGRQVPRTGGFILAVARNRAAIEAVIAEDPFVRNGVAEYRVLEVEPTKAAPAMQALLAQSGAWS